MKRETLPPRRWATWIRNGHPHERSLRENSDLFFMYLPEVRERRSRYREPADDPPVTMAAVRDEIGRQLAELQANAGPAVGDSDLPKVTIPRKQYRKLKSGCRRA